jgi:hypothetical protein
MDPNPFRIQYSSSQDDDIKSFEIGFQTQPQNVFTNVNLPVVHLTEDTIFIDSIIGLVKSNSNILLVNCEILDSIYAKNLFLYQCKYSNEVYATENAWVHVKVNADGIAQSSGVHAGREISFSYEGLVKEINYVSVNSRCDLQFAEEIQSVTLRNCNIGGDLVWIGTNSNRTLRLNGTTTIVGKIIGDPIIIDTRPN